MKSGLLKLAMLSAMAFAVGIAGYPASAVAQDAKPLIPVSISWNKVAGQLIAPVAAAKGFGKDYGIDLSLVSFASAADSMQTTIAGQTGGAFGATVPTGPSLIANGVPIKSVLIYAYGGDRLALVTLKSSGIASLDQLAGKRLAGPVGNTAQQLEEAILAGAGIDPKTVGFVNMDYPDLPAALATGQIDAAIFAEPTLSAFTTTEPDAVILARGGKYVSAQGSFYMSQALLDAPDDAAYKTYLTLARAAQYIRQQGAGSDEIAQILSDATGLSLDLTKVSAAGTMFDPRIKPWIWTQTQNDMNFFIGIDKLDAPIEQDELFDVSLQERAIKEHPELFSDLDAYLTAAGADADQLLAP